MSDEKKQATELCLSGLTKLCSMSGRTGCFLLSPSKVESISCSLNLPIRTTNSSSKVCLADLLTLLLGPSQSLYLLSLSLHLFSLPLEHIESKPCVLAKQCLHAWLLQKSRVLGQGRVYRLAKALIGVQSIHDDVLCGGDKGLAVPVLSARPPVRTCCAQCFECRKVVFVGDCEDLRLQEQLGCVAGG